MALTSLIRLRKIPAGNHGLRPASTKARLRSRGRQRWSDVQPAGNVSAGYQKTIRHRAWTSKRALLGETARPVALSPHAQDRSRSHVSLASSPAIFMTRSRRRERDKHRRDSPSPTHLGPASKAPTPSRFAAVGCAAHAIGVLSRPACDMSSQRPQSTCSESHPGQTERRSPKRAAPSSRLSNSVPPEFAASVNVGSTPRSRMQLNSGRRWHHICECSRSLAGVGFPGRGIGQAGDLGKLVSRHRFPQ